MSMATTSRSAASALEDRPPDVPVGAEAVDEDERRAGARAVVGQRHDAAARSRTAATDSPAAPTCSGLEKASCMTEIRRSAKPASQ